MSDLNAEKALRALFAQAVTVVSGKIFQAATPGATVTFTYVNPVDGKSYTAQGKAFSVCAPPNVTAVKTQDGQWVLTSASESQGAARDTTFLRKARPKTDEEFGKIKIFYGDATNFTGIEYTYKLYVGGHTPKPTLIETISSNQFITGFITGATTAYRSGGLTNLGGDKWIGGYARRRNRVTAETEIINFRKKSKAIVTLPVLTFYSPMALYTNYLYYPGLRWGGGGLWNTANQELMEGFSSSSPPGIITTGPYSASYNGPFPGGGGSSTTYTEDASGSSASSNGNWNFTPVAAYVWEDELKYAPAGSWTYSHFMRSKVVYGGNDSMITATSTNSTLPVVVKPNGPEFETSQLSFQFLEDFGSWPHSQPTLPPPAYVNRKTTRTIVPLISSTDGKSAVYEEFTILGGYGIYSATTLIKRIFFVGPEGKREVKTLIDETFTSSQSRINGFTISGPTGVFDYLNSSYCDIASSYWNLVGNNLYEVENVPDLTKFRNKSKAVVKSLNLVTGASKRMEVPVFPIQMESSNPLLIGISYHPR